VGKLEGKKPLGRSIFRCVDNIEKHLGEMEWGGVDWICLAQDRDQWRALLNKVMNRQIP
jgi:hypothetical protein